MECMPEVTSISALFLGMFLMTFATLLAVALACAPFALVWWLWHKLTGD